MIILVIPLLLPPKMMKEQRTEISDLGEFGLIQHLTQEIELTQVNNVLGIGDDAAVIDPFGNQIALSTDMLIEGIHFDLTYMPLKHVGYKAVTVNLSDIYAMMATPISLTVSIGISNRFSVEALNELYDGIKLACKHYQVDLVGGDTTSSQKGLIISITAVGLIDKQEFVSRAGAKENDLICVTGDLGAAYLGLLLLEREKKIFLENPLVKPDLGTHTYLLQRFMKPEPQRRAVEWMKENRLLPTAMIDISDGLSSEVLHLCKQSGTGCLLYEEKLPLHDETRAAAGTFGLAATTCALNGGEDYELLFTLSPSDFDKIKEESWLSVIGHMTSADQGCKLITSGDKKIDLKAQGWNHMNP